LSNSGDEFKAILAPSISGRTVRMLSRFRPAVKLIGAAHDCVNRRKMTISYGVCPINCGMLVEKGRKFKYASQVFRKCCDIAVKERFIIRGDMVIFTAGTPLFVTGTTNLIQIKEVEKLTVGHHK
jgi:pyruvate kinase